MSFTYFQTTGIIKHESETIGNGYSGHEEGKNNPTRQAARGIGPIPRGRWSIDSVKDSKNTGPFTLVLSACPDTVTCGRGAFRIHGDSIKFPGTASHGCIILPRHVREIIWTIAKNGNPDNLLEVV